MLTMDMIGLPLHLLKLDKIKPQEENQKRLKQVVVRNFTSALGALQGAQSDKFVYDFTCFHTNTYTNMLIWAPCKAPKAFVKFPKWWHSFLGPQRNKPCGGLL